VVAGRFVLEALAGSGGMGTVHRARDRTTGGLCALKLLHDPHGGDRFLREARVLERLTHPGIVRHVAHGALGSDEVYLAMEWLEGEDLSDRLARGRLAVGEAVTLLTRVAEAVASAHAEGIVHRDLKPSNLFLPDCDVARVKVLDFGVARLGEASAFTRTGALLGTPGYMAPEQARGERGVDERADVFALGCVLFEALTGEAAFPGAHGIAVLAKVLFEEAPRLADVRPEVPLALGDLVGRMLAKDPADRPRDAAAVARALAALGPLDEPANEAPPPPREARPSTLTTSEQRRLFVVVAGVDLRPADLSSAPTLAQGEEDASRALAREAGARFGARLEWLLDGSAIAILSGSGTATDQAVQAARCALAMRAALPEAPLALATGRGVLTERLPFGDVIDHALEALAASTGGAGVFLDASTAALLDDRFEVASGPRGLELRGERDAAPGVRTLLGRPTPCVGREREIAAIVALFDECAAEPGARAVLVTAPAGVGKSRLRHEVLRALAARDAPRVWSARGDPMSAGAPLGMVAQLVRSAIGAGAGEAPAAVAARLEARVAERVPRAQAPRVAGFLGELLGAPLPDAGVEIRAARQDPALLGDQTRAAWEAFVVAECAAGPVVLALEDLHWGDVPTVRFVDGALRAAERLPLFVLGLGRPEVFEAFPRLWAGRSVDRIELRELSRRSAERLARLLLGASVPAAAIEALIDRSGGNAFYLEELIRAAAQGDTGELPDTVLAMLEARLERLDPEARRVLRAASVFGEVFHRGAVAALRGDRAGDTDAWLAHLVEGEVVERRADSRFPGELEYGFRHALWRDAAHASLTAADRVLGHRLAGEWLERAGERDAAVLAAHFDRAGEADRAVGWYIAAAAQALDANDHAAVLARASRGIALGAAGARLGSLEALLMRAHFWRGELVEAEPHGAAAGALLPRGGLEWCRNAGMELTVASQLGRPSRVAEVIQEIASTEPEPSAAFAHVVGVATAVSTLCLAGYAAVTRPMLERLTRLTAGAPLDPVATGWIEWARSMVALFVDDDPYGDLRHAERAVACFEQVGDVRGASMATTSVGSALLALGQSASAERVLREARERAASTGNDYFARVARLLLGRALGKLGAFDEAREHAADVVSALEKNQNRVIEGWARASLATILADGGDAEGAEREARRALDLLLPTSPMRGPALTVLARLRLGAGHAREALALTREATAPIDAGSGYADGESIARLLHAEALEACGDAAGARAALERARERLLARAGRIEDPAMREAYLALPENARVLELAGAAG
jgi:tetratricopeptide (TPR) repeat protein